METVKAIFDPQILIQARKERGLTQEQLAIRAGISQSAITNIEKGWNKASTETLAAICRILCIPMETLFFFKENSNDTDKHLTDYQ